MSPSPRGTISGSASGAEKNASMPTPASTSPAATPKPRSCVVCRSRKVRCDKQSPCSNCRRAGIPCVLPSTDRPPRWARRLDRITGHAAASNTRSAQDVGPGVDQVMQRLRNLEALVRELNGQLEQANASAGVAESQAGSVAGTPGTGVQSQVGRLVSQDTGRSRYISSGFWSRVNDEIHGLKMDTQGLQGHGSDSSEDEQNDSYGTTPSTRELERTPLERHAFLFGHNLSPAGPDLRDFHPLPSQIPFLVNVYAENVNMIISTVHIPTITKIVREMRSRGTESLTPANEALMFSIYYAAVTSMEEDDVRTNFGASKTDLNLKYRVGLEHALAKADFLNVPDIILVQAFTIFLYLVRRHDSPRFVWMMVGLVIRMAQSLGLHQDGSHFDHLTPYEVEIRRRVWWALCMLDVRASEDQGTDLTIAPGSFDTRLPLNLDDGDINKDTKEMPQGRVGLTDLTFALTSFETCSVTRQMMALGIKEGNSSLEDCSRLLHEMYQTLDRNYLQYVTNTAEIQYWVMVTCTRLVIAKMTLILYLPILFSSPSERFSSEMRTKLLVATIEVAEYNHALNAEPSCRQWRWIYQTYTHWHAIVYILIEASRRPWSPLVERAWVALHSVWLIPAQQNVDRNLRIWVPLRKLMAKARRHREAELQRLRGDTNAARTLEAEEREIALPESSSNYPPLPVERSGEMFRERWYQLVSSPGSVQQPGYTVVDVPRSDLHAADVSQNPISPAPRQPIQPSWNPSSSELDYLATGAQFNSPAPNTSISTNPSFSTPSSMTQPAQTTNPLPESLSAIQGDWSNDIPWLWADADSAAPGGLFGDVDIEMISDGEVDWNNWLESAKGVEWGMAPGGDQRG